MATDALRQVHWLLLLTLLSGAVVTVLSEERCAGKSSVAGCRSDLESTEAEAGPGRSTQGAALLQRTSLKHKVNVEVTEPEEHSELEVTEQEGHSELKLQTTGVDDSNPNLEDPHVADTSKMTFAASLLETFNGLPVLSWPNVKVVLQLLAVLGLLVAAVVTPRVRARRASLFEATSLAEAKKILDSAMEFEFRPAPEESEVMTMATEQMLKRHVLASTLASTPTSDLWTKFKGQLPEEVDDYVATGGQSESEPEAEMGASTPEEPAPQEEENKGDSP